MNQWLKYGSGLLCGLILANGCRRTSTTTGVPAAYDCAVTKPILATGPENTEGGPPGSELSTWHVNPDRTIWMLGGIELVPGERAKVAWFRPAGTDLKLSGRRLDGPAPPAVFEAGTGAEYRHRFTPSSMTFPSEGCWEIVAKAGSSEAKFVIKVPSRAR